MNDDDLIPVELPLVFRAIVFVVGIWACVLFVIVAGALCYRLSSVI